MKRPNFFLVGAPKCGTTALSSYLSEHRNVFMCKPKEPRYFAEELDSIRTARTLDEYLGLFADASEMHSAVGEASVWYLYFSESLRRIRDFEPKAKIIVMLRNPVDMVYALHSQCLYNHLEDNQDFYAAWQLQERRANGHSLPSGCPNWKTLMYRDIGLLGAQVECLLTIFPRDQVLLILHEDFKQSSKKVYQQTLEFLGLPVDSRGVFRPINLNKRHRFKSVAWANRRGGRLWEISARAVKRALRIDGPIGLRAKLLKLNTIVEPREPLNPEFRRALTEVFAEDVVRLSHIVQRDLSHWLSFTAEQANRNTIALA